MKQAQTTLSLLATSLCLLASLSACAQDSGQIASWRQYLTTPHYNLTISNYCQVGEEECDNLLLEVEHRRTHKVLRLRGEDVTASCQNDPCRHTGFRFEADDFYFFISDDGLFKQMQGKKTLFTEKGFWADSTRQ